MFRKVTFVLLSVFAISACAPSSVAIKDTEETVRVDDATKENIYPQVVTWLQNSLKTNWGEIKFKDQSSGRVLASIFYDCSRIENPSNSGYEMEFDFEVEIKDEEYTINTKFVDANAKDSTMVMNAGDRVEDYPEECNDLAKQKLDQTVNGLKENVSP